MKGTIGTLVVIFFALVLALVSKPAKAGEFGVPGGWGILLSELVEINSGTENLEGIERVRGVVAREFEALGLSVRVVEAGASRKLLVAETPDAAPRLMLIGHLDTVFGTESETRALYAEGDRMIGPGVIDMKGGIVMMIQTLWELKAGGMLHHLRIVLNDDEETGSPQSRDELKALAAGIPYGLVLEPGLSDGAVVTGHSGVRWLKLSVGGKAAHAGLEPELGINACVEAAHKATKMAKLSDYSRGLSVNLGVISGGEKPNVVCDRAEMSFDIRFRSETDLELTLERAGEITRQMTVFNPLLGQYPSADLLTLAQLPSMPSEATADLFGIAAQAAATVGQNLKGRAVGYASDGNHLASTGMKLLVGLGPYGGGMHTADEFMSIRSFGERVRLNKQLIINILAKGEN